MGQNVVGGIRDSRRNVYLGLCIIFLLTRLTISSDVFGRPDSFLLHKQHSSLNVLCRVQISIAVGDCLENSLTNARYTVLFDCDRAYSNTHDTFSLPVIGIFISVEIKPSNFDLFKNRLSK